MTASILDHAEGGLFSLPAGQMATLIPVAHAKGLDVVTLDLAHARSTRQGLQQLGKALQLPDWYAANFDALFDCLADPAWQAERGLLLCLNGLARWQNPDDRETLLDVLTAICEAREESATPIWIAIDMPLPGIAEFPLA